MQSDFTDTHDTSRAALEALAERLGRHSIGRANELEDDLVQAAATLRALVARAEPASDVASLVQAAREFAGKAMRAADAYRETRRRELAEEREEVADLANRLAAALTAQAERIAVIEQETAELMIDVEGADQDGALVGYEYTATGMRFTIRGALAAALAAHLAAASTEQEAELGLEADGGEG